MGSPNVEESREADAGESSDVDTGDWLTSIRSVTDGAILYMGTTVASRGINFLLNLILTNALGVGLYGIYSLGRRIVGSVLLFTNLGTDVSITRYLSGNLDDPQYQNRVFLLSYLTSGVVSVIAAAALFVAAPIIDAYTFESPVFVDALRLFAVAIPFMSLTKIAANSFRGLEMPVHQNVVMIVSRLIRLLAIGLAVLLGYSLVGVTAAFTAGCAVVLVVATYGILWRTRLRPSLGLDAGELKGFFDYSIPLSVSRAGNLLYNRVDIFMIGIILTQSDVGVYSIAMLLAGVTTMPRAGFNQLFPPVASRLYSNDNLDTLQAVYGSVTRWIITVTLVMVIPLVLYRRDALAVFGEDFAAGALVLVVLVGGQLVNGFAGPSNDILTMTDHQYVVMVNHWAFGIANVVLNYLFIHEFGVVGAALATATVLAALNVCRIIEVWYFVGLLPYSRRLWKPFAAALGSAAVAYGATYFLDGIPLLVVGSALAALAFGGLLLLFGIEQRDMELARNYSTLLD